LSFNWVLGMIDVVRWFATMRVFVVFVVF
jgi:hypothetical protein